MTGSALELASAARRLSVWDVQAVAAWEVALVAAERERNDPLIQEGLEELSEAETWTGMPDRALVTVTRLIGFHDARGTGSDGTLLWRLKWTLEHLPAFSQISEARARALQADFERRLEAGGHSPRTGLAFRAHQELAFGRTADAVRVLEEALTHPRDSTSDCRACEASQLVRARAAAGQYERALSEAAPIASGRLGCAEVPHVTYGALMVSKGRLGQWDEAERDHQRGYPLVRRNDKLVLAIAEHLAYSVAAGKLTRGLDLFERHLRLAHEYPAAGYRLTFYRSAEYLFERLERAGDAPLKVRIPRSYPLPRRAPRTPSMLRESLRMRIEAEQTAFRAASNPYPAASAWAVDAFRPVEQPVGN